MLRLLRTGLDWAPSLLRTCAWQEAEMLNHVSATVCNNLVIKPVALLRPVVKNITTCPDQCCGSDDVGLQSLLLYPSENCNPRWHSALPACTDHQTVGGPIGLSALKLPRKRPRRNGVPAAASPRRATRPSLALALPACTDHRIAGDHIGRKP